MSNFQLNKSIAILERTPGVLWQLLFNLEHGWTSINEGEDTWSAFDIMGHLIQGERKDWIPRTKIILSDATDKTFAPFDRFEQKELTVGKSIEELIVEFERLRIINIKELKEFNLNEHDLNKTGIHPEFGQVTLKELLATWTIHDLSHLNQISRVMVKHYANDIGPWGPYFSLVRD